MHRKATILFSNFAMFAVLPGLLSICEVKIPQIEVGESTTMSLEQDCRVVEADLYAVVK